MTRITNQPGKYTAALVLIVLSASFMGCIDSSEDDDIPDDNGYTSLNNNLMSGDINNLPLENLSDEERAGILYMREEEKLARDVYLTLYDNWSKNIFKNIAESEDTHTSSIKLLIDRYSLQDPFMDERGKFNNSDLQKLYDDLVANGSKSYLDALMVGAVIEELDLKDIEEYLNLSDNRDIELVYENLMMGSRNHLRSFVSNIEKEDVEYEPVYLSEEEFQNIINSDMESNKYRQ